MKKSNLEIQKFLDKVKDEVKALPQTCDTVTFEDFWNKKHSADDMAFDNRAFLSDIVFIQHHNQISYYQELTSYRKGISVIVKPIKKVIRKLVAFLFLPIIREQNTINAANARLAMHMRGYVNKDNSYRELLIKRDREMEMKLKEQKRVINELLEKVNELNDKVNALENGGKD